MMPQQPYIILMSFIVMENHAKLVMKINGSNFYTISSFAIAVATCKSKIINYLSARALLVVRPYPR